MLCAAQWKTCDCPWFNYEAVEADRLNHMNVPGELGRPIFLRLPGRAPGLQRNNNNRNNHPAFGYEHEMQMRRQQERLDEEMARRMQMLDLEGDLDDFDVIDVEAGPAGEPVFDENLVRRAHEVLTRRLDPAQAEVIERLLNEHRRRDNHHNHIAPRPRQQRWQPPRPPTPTPSPPAQNETAPAPAPAPTAAPAPEPARVRRSLNRNNTTNTPRPRPRVTAPLEQQQQPQQPQQPRPMPAAPTPPTPPINGTAPAQNRPAPIRRANTTATANPGRARLPRQQLPGERNRPQDLDPSLLVLPSAPTPPPPTAPGSGAARARNARARDHRAPPRAGFAPPVPGGVPPGGSRVDQWRHWADTDWEAMHS